MNFKQIKVGVLGGGQLGRMMYQDAISIDLDIHFLDGDPNAPCASISPNFVIGSITDFDTVYTFGKDKDIVTIEIENVNTDALEKLEKEGIKIHPSPASIRLIQDKGLQKQFYQEHQIPTADFILLNNLSDLENHLDFLPAFQKLRKGGYDGKGVCPINDSADIPNGFDAPSVLEKTVDYEKEISVICARNESREIIAYPPVELVADPQYNLLDYLLAPANISSSVAEEAKAIALKVTEKLEIVGLLAIEMFVTKDQKVLVNEVAPRPHNSGHHTIEANITSQFEQHLRAVCNIPLGSTSTILPATMINLIGAEGHKGTASYEGATEVLRSEGVYIHLYGKKDTKPGRKMGHLTVINQDVEKAIEIAQKVKGKIKIVASK